MDDKQIILTSFPLRQLTAMISVAVNEALKNYHRQPAQPEQQVDQLLNIKDAAKFLNLKVPTIYSKVSKGELPVMKRSNRLYFSKNELMQYLREGRKKSNSEIEAEANNYLNKNQK